MPRRCGKSRCAATSGTSWMSAAAWDSSPGRWSPPRRLGLRHWASNAARSSWRRRIALADDDHDVLRLWPEPPGFGPLWQAYTRVYDRLGGDPLAGRRLVWFLHQAGAAPRRNGVVFFGSCAGHPDFGLYVTNLAGV